VICREPSQRLCIVPRGARIVEKSANGTGEGASIATVDGEAKVPRGHEVPDNALAMGDHRGSDRCRLEEHSRHADVPDVRKRGRSGPGEQFQELSLFVMPVAQLDVHTRRKQTFHEPIERKPVRRVGNAGDDESDARTVLLESVDEMMKALAFGECAEKDESVPFAGRRGRSSQSRLRDLVHRRPTLPRPRARCKRIGRQYGMRARCLTPCPHHELVRLSQEHLAGRPDLRRNNIGRWAHARAEKQNAQRSAHAPTGEGAEHAVGVQMEHVVRAHGGDRAAKEIDLGSQRFPALSAEPPARVDRRK